MNVLVLASRKGGTGKSTLAAHLAAQAHRPGKPVVLIDTDPPGSLTLWHELRGTGEPEIRRAGRSLSDTLKQAARAGAALAIVDTPPNKSALVTEAIRAATLVVIPTRPAIFDLAAVEATIEMCREANRPYAVVMNACPAKRNASESQIVADARAGLRDDKVPVWGGQITQRSDYALSLADGLGAREYDPGAPAAAEMAQLWSAISRSLGAINGAHKAARAMHRLAA